jgi:hypothetical protein
MELERNAKKPPPMDAFLSYYLREPGVHWFQGVA